MNANALTFAKTESFREALSLLREARGSMLSRIYESTTTYLLAERLLRGISQIGGAPYAISIEREMASDKISMLFSLPSDYSAIVQIDGIGLSIGFYARVLPYTSPSEYIDCQPQDAQSGCLSRVKSPQDCTVSLPSKYTLMPLVYKEGDAFAPWLVASAYTYERSKYKTMALRVVNYVALAMEYDQLKDSSCFAGTETQEPGEWLVLGYAPLEEISDNYTKMKVLISGSTGWVCNNRPVFCLPISDLVYFYPARVTRNNVLVCALSQDMEIQLVPHKRYAWVPVSSRLVALLTDMTAEEFLSHEENISRLYNAIQTIRAMDSDGDE